MRPADIHARCAHIRDAFDDLQQAWAEAAESWNDEVSRSFCEKHLEPLGPTVKLALDSIARMSHLADHMHRDCDS